MHHDKIALSNAAGGRNLLDHDKRAELPSRRRSNENIDASRTHLNSDLSARKMDPGKAWNWAVAYAQEHAARKLRSNQIVMSEDIIHLPDNWAEVSGGKPDSVFFESVALPFLRGRYGYGENDTENEISAVVHRDEVVKTGPNAGHTTPHLHWKSVPVDRNGKLSHKSVHSRQDLQRLHKDFLRFCESRGYPGLHVYDEERAKAREDALSMPAYKQAMEVADRAAERASEAKKAADAAKTAQKAAESRRRAAEASQADAQAKLRGLKTAVDKKQGQAADLDSQISKKMDQKAKLQAEISSFSKKRDRAEDEAIQSRNAAAAAKADAEGWQAIVKDVQGISYTDAEGHERMGIAGMEKAYIESQERMKAAKEQEKAYVAQASQAKADAKEWQIRAARAQRAAEVTPDSLRMALSVMVVNIAEACIMAYDMAREMARDVWHIWLDWHMPTIAQDLGIDAEEGRKISEDVLIETCEYNQCEEVADYLLEDGQEHEQDFYQER